MSDEDRKKRNMILSEHKKRWRSNLSQKSKKKIEKKRVKSRKKFYNSLSDEEKNKYSAHLKTK